MKLKRSLYKNDSLFEDWRNAGVAWRGVACEHHSRNTYHTVQQANRLLVARAGAGYAWIYTLRTYSELL
jgi:hypothetical protein